MAEQLKTGTVVNYLTVKSLSEIISTCRGHLMHVYLCECVCGNQVEVYQGELVSGHIKSCGCKGEVRKQFLTYDLTGQRCGYLQVIDQAKTLWSDSGKSRRVRWNCLCDCGNYVTVDSRALRTGATQSCGCYQKQRVSEALTDDLIGKKFGALCVIERAGSHIRKNSKCGMQAMWKCRCECGNEIVTYGWSLKVGDTVSCGCLKTSIAEKTVSEILTEYGFVENETYFREKTFPDLISENGGNLRFDFVVKTKSETIMIECQGAQHYSPVKWFGGEEAFVRRRQNDKLKRLWTKNHNYRLIEIPYTVLSKNEFLNILIKERVIELANRISE